MHLFSRINGLFYRYFDSLEVKHRESSWKLIHKSLNKLYSDLENFFNNFDPKERNDYCNVLKMIVYVFCYMSEQLEGIGYKTGHEYRLR